MSLTHLANSFISNISSKEGKLPCSFVIHTEKGESLPIGKEKPVFELYIRNQAGLRAIQSLNQLTIAEAYIIGNIDITGDFTQAMSFAEHIPDANFWIKMWRHIQPWLFGLEKCNSAWIAKHYASADIQLLVLESDYNTYTQCLYEHDDDSLEACTERKLGMVFEALKLKSNAALLDVGCGWGGLLRYSARRGIQVTGITLAENQKVYVDNLIKENDFDAQVMIQDLFSFQPPKKYDSIAAIGVMEHLPDYPKVMTQLSKCIKPGGRVYMDFLASNNLSHPHTFITKYIWPGTHHMVFMPQFIEAIRASPFEIVSIHNDRRNYYLWIEEINRRWELNKAEIVKQSSEELWRIFRILYAGSAVFLGSPAYGLTAYRVVLEYPADLRLH